ncbi:MAG TPA: alpha-hydroxy acid oxidase [Nakamurella multipartita]|nr:alpha-hydroxy acid oxidase [Nakamurella multipartita]
MLAVLHEQVEKARSVLTPEVFDYYDAGSGDQLTRAESGAAWADYRFRPFPLRDVSAVDTASTALGVPVATPIAIAPSAFQRLAHPDGERATAAAAGQAGSLFVLSTRASLPIAEVAAAATGPWWFQVYVMRDRELTRRVVADAVTAGARALVLTGDTPYVGRKRQVRGTRIPLPDDHFLVNIAPHLAPGVDGRAAAAQDPSIGLETIDWLRREFGLPVLVKGVLRGDAADECLRAGAAGVIVSNHGGRQLDRAVPSAHALGDVVDAVAGRAPVYVDGGISCGLDVLTALALGAHGVLIGRPVLWALAAGGCQAVAETLSAMTDDLRHAMALTGVAGLDQINRSLLHH